MRRANYGEREREGESAPPVFCKGGKRFYPSRARAKRAVKQARRDGRSIVAVYDCPLCPGWHLTSEVQFGRKAAGRTRP